MPFVERRGLRFHLQELGAAADPPVVMLHGLFTGSLASWWFTAGPVLARSHHVRLVDLRGHGLSDRPMSGYDRATMLADVVALTEDLAPFAVIGHSYGALLGLHLALTHPERVTALAAVEAPLVDLPKGRVRDGRDDHRGAHRRRDAHPLEATTLVADLQADPVLTDDALAGLAAPALFLFGSRSGYVGGADRVRRVLPRAGCDLLDGGHTLHVDARDEVAERLASFLADPEPEAVAYG